MRAFLDLDPAQYGLSESLSNDIRRLDTLLGHVLGTQEGPELVNLARRIMSGEPLSSIEELNDPAQVRQLARAFTVLFQLINVAEQKEIVRVNRGRANRRESIDDAVAHLKERGANAEDVRKVLSQLEISPTLTAHPTEAKRKAVLDKLQSVAILLAEDEAPPSLTAPLDAAGQALEEVTRTLEVLWQTDEMRAQRLTVPEEVRNAIYFFERTVMQVVPWLHNDLARALAKHYPGEEFEIPTFLTYRSWVGGDRDGNPNVTPEITWNTLLDHRIVALENHLRAAETLRKEFTQSTKLVPVSDELAEDLARQERELPYRPEQLQRYSQEPYVLKMLGVEYRLGQTLQQAQSMLANGRRNGFEHVYESPQDLIADLKVVQRSLHRHLAIEVATKGRLPEFIRQVDAFGFHLATLDIRQHSDEHAKAIDELFTIAGVLRDGKRYLALSEEEKVALLTKELDNPRPLLPIDDHGSAATRHVLDVFHVVRRARRELSTRSVVAYVISMTHGQSDLLEVLLLCKEAGLLRITPTGVETELDVVPLFETIEDLHNCGPLMRELLANPAYRRHLNARGGTQEIMLGYSDSSKDGGYFAANWSLQATLSEVARVSRETGVPMRLFHGRGGTVGRGGGRANRAILSQPEGSFSGKIRFTEQGEVISFRYSLPPIAHRHLEQIVGAAILATHGAGARGAEEKYGELMTIMEETSRAKYRSLVYENEEFWPFYTQATPIEHISLLPIASRPVSRGSNAISGVSELRAIPWNFAWVQSRHTMVGWYGLGAAIRERLDAGESEVLQAMYREWPFFRMVIDNAQLELMRAYLPTARLYAKRVQPAEVGERVEALIEDEYFRTRQAILEVTGKNELLSHARVVRNTVEFRNPMVEPLSRLQVWLMDKWQTLTEDEREGTWREAMLQSIAGIAAAMQSTG